MISADEFWRAVDESLANATCLRITLSRRTASAPQMPDKLTARPTLIKGVRSLQWASRLANRETHENLTPEQTGSRIRELLGSVYEQAHVATEEADFEIQAGPAGPTRIRQSRPSGQTVPLAHNRAKAYLIPENVPCDFLMEIGVMTSTGKVRASKMGKFRQVNRFLELVNDVLKDLPAVGTLRVIDFGSGKSYLTFALHHLLAGIHKRDVQITAYERREDIVAECRRLSQRLGCVGLEFHAGEIAEQTIPADVDLAVALHACDTATDDALAQAVGARAGAILAVPCCQHELATKIRDPKLAPLHRRGILHERFASLATDALRAEALEACGYKTQVVEFVDLEHTAKNLMIRAIRRTDAEQAGRSASEAYQSFKQALGLGTIAADRILESGCRNEPPTQ